jgi:hypothetical protein
VTDDYLSEAIIQLELRVLGPRHGLTDKRLEPLREAGYSLVPSGPRHVLVEQGQP